MTSPFRRRCDTALRRDAATRVFFIVLAALFVFVLSAPFWRPPWEAAIWARCRAGYDSARTAADSAVVDHRRPLMPQLELVDQRISCADLKRTRAR